VTLVDLRGRHDEEAVRGLLALAHGSPESLERAVARYATGEWMLTGWDDDGELAATCGVHRVDDDELRLRSVAVAPGRRRRGIGRALVGALAAAATAKRLVAETDADGAGFYERCGFEVTSAGGGRFRCVRPIAPVPADQSQVAAFTLAELEDAVRGAFGADTTDDPDGWTEQNPALGHCDVTVLVVRELLGGEILIAGVVRDGARTGRHAWNRLPSGLAVDLTRSQFVDRELFEEPHAGEPMVMRRARERYELFAGRVYGRLGLNRLQAPRSHSHVRGRG
jgi:N-acetylglutamate synthase-like GNAT family acetyltransferase